MAGIVTFNYAAWVALFPEFAAVTEPTATAYFNQATLIQTNNGFGPVTTDALLLSQLNLLTAHIAALFSNGASPAASNAPVGRLNSATEGSVSAGFEWAGATAASAWYLQTKYGAMYWQAMAPYRTARYVPGRVLASSYRGPGYGYGYGYGRRGW